MISRVTTAANKSLEGKTVAEAAGSRGEEPASFVVDLLAQEEGMVDAILFTMSEENLREVLRQPFVTIGSDAAARAPEGILAEGKPHPRAFGTFARVLGLYARDEGVLDLGSAIRKMTWLSCTKVGLHSRGAIRPGNWADLVVLDPESVRDRANYTEPIAFPEGIEFVVVNGEVTVERGTHVGTRAGKVLRKGAQG